MLREVTRLCKGDFGGLVKEHQVWQWDLYADGWMLATFQTKKEAEKFRTDKENEAKGTPCKYTAFSIEEVKY
ncbi:hypothetical protein PJV89_05435 [Aliarcobacter butzleri]|uniref:hypothetical protein n=1 Tax=Aliarcobacter butzleri TaxID=28197 RepID=UPI00263D87AC|nr:hypothetical protein [Aliarcobacter butzleri]MDN5077614.1 hypothetical protein [Aliarcobacter butzleri]MDN5118838.1 hypothetical protein [Aliarcobacter butzleri]